MTDSGARASQHYRWCEQQQIDAKETWKQIGLGRAKQARRFEHLRSPSVADTFDQITPETQARERQVCLEA
jgi:hypothetical protein